MKKYRILKIADSYIPQRMGFWGWITLTQPEGWALDIECGTVEEAEKAIDRDNRGIKIEVVKEIKKGK
jgi:hypothetical protein